MTFSAIERATLAAGSLPAIRFGLGPLVRLPGHRLCRVDGTGLPVDRADGQRKQGRRTPLLRQTQGNTAGGVRHGKAAPFNRRGTAMGRGHEDSDLDEVMRPTLRKRLFMPVLAAADTLAVAARCLGGSRQALPPRLGTAAWILVGAEEARKAVVGWRWTPSPAGMGPASSRSGDRSPAQRQVPSARVWSVPPP